MKERLSILSYKYRLSVFVFMFMFLIFTLSPLTGDVIEGFDLSRRSIQNLSLNNFLISFFANNRLILNIIFASLFSFFIYGVNSLVENIRNKHLYLFIIIEILLVGVLTFSYNYISIRGAIFFTIPALLILLYFINFNRSIVFKIIISLIIINLNISLGLYFFIANLVYYFLSKKKVSKIVLVVQLLNIILIQNIYLVIFVGDISTLKSNISLSITNLFSDNILIFILGAIPINYYLRENLKNNMYRRVKLFIFNIPLIFALVYNFGNYFPVNLDLILTRYNGVFAIENYYYISYFILYIYFYVLSINHYIKNSKIKNLLNSFQIISILIFIQSILQVNFDRSLLIFIIFTTAMATLLMLSEIKIKIYPRLTILVAVGLMFYYLSIFSLIKVLEEKRVEYINEQVVNNQEKIIIRANPFRLILKNNQVSDKIKEFYKIPLGKEIEVKYLGIFGRIEKKVK